MLDIAIDDRKGAGREFRGKGCDQLVRSALSEVVCELMYARVVSYDEQRVAIFRRGSYHVENLVRGGKIKRPFKLRIWLPVQRRRKLRESLARACCIGNDCLLRCKPFALEKRAHMHGVFAAAYDQFAGMVAREVCAFGLGVAKQEQFAHGRIIVRVRW